MTRPRLLRGRILAMAVLALAAALAGTAPARGEICPLNSIRFISPTGTRYPAAHRDSSYYSESGSGYSTQSAAYDLQVGTAHGAATSEGQWNGHAEVIMKDTYRVVGPPRATPLAFSAEWRIIGSGFALSTPEYSAQAWVFAEVAEGANMRELDDGTWRINPLDTDRTMSLALQHAVGERFTLAYTLECGSWRSASADFMGSFTFVGLPAGYGVVSCQGFASSPTPATSTTWGRVKARYR